MCQNSNTSITVAGIDIGKNSFHVVGLDQRGAMQIGVRAGHRNRKSHPAARSTRSE